LDPVDHTPTEALDYAALSALYGALLAGTAVSGRRRGPIPATELPGLAAASFALSKLVVHEKVESNGGRPKGRRLRYAVGELLTCTRCTGAWSALALTALRLHAPAAGRTVTTVLAASAGNDMLQAAFTWMCAHASTEQRVARGPVDPAQDRASAGLSETIAPR